MIRRFALLAAVALIAVLAMFGAAQAQGDTAPDAPGSPCAGLHLERGTSRHILELGGLTREYLVYIPDSYTGTQPVPLVISLHGFGEIPALQERDSGWDAIAEREDFIVVYPAGTGSPARWNAGQRDIPGLKPEGGGLLAQFLNGFFETVQADDVAFIRRLVFELEAFNCIDSARIYVNGMSNGGGMTNRLACQAADLFAAAGMVAGAYTDFPGGCYPARPMPVVAFHGVTDPIVPYAGSERVHFPAIETWVADWAKRDSCASTPEPIAGTVGDVTGIRYTACADQAEVAFYAIADGGHTWPGGSMSLQFLLGKTSRDIDASETMWTFFQAHPLQ